MGRGNASSEHSSAMAADGDFSPCFEYDHVWQSFEAMGVANPSTKCLMDFENPKKHRSWTYQEVMDGCTSITQACRNYSVANQPVFVVLMDRGPIAFHAMMSCFRVGGVYVPVPPSTTPVDRFVQVLEACQILNTPIVIYDKFSKDACSAVEQASKLFKFHSCMVDLDKKEHKVTLLKEKPAAEAECALRPNFGLGAIIFTSGSTGVPKGVLLENKALVRHFSAYWKAGQHLNVGDRTLAVTALGFDMSLLEQLYSTLQGAGLVFVSKQDLVTSLVEKMVEHSINMIFCTPSLLALSSADPSIVKSLVGVDMGGESPTPDLIRAWSAPFRSIYNGYGPSEITIGCCHAKLGKEDADNIHIGKGLHGYDLYIVNAEGKLAEQGELLVGGPCVSPGYLGDQAKTDDKFIDNPYGKAGKIYKTGDIVRRNANGNLEFVGREDDQVKILGNRVELSEIETAVSQIPGVLRCCVPFDKKTSSLMCIVILEEPEGKTGITLADEEMCDRFKNVLGHRVPPYMIPSSWFVSHEPFPITTNQKTDKRKLMAVCSKLEEPAQALQGTPLEMLMAIIEHLQKGCDGPPKPVLETSNLLEEFGFSSLQLISINNTLKKSNMSMSLSALYSSSNLKELASKITPIKKDCDVKVEGSGDSVAEQATLRAELEKVNWNISAKKSSQPLSRPAYFMMENLIILIHLAIELVCFCFSGAITLSGIRYCVLYYPAFAEAAKSSALTTILGIALVTMVMTKVAGTVEFYVILSVKKILGPVSLGVHSRHSLVFFKYLLLEHLGRDVMVAPTSYSWLTIRHYRMLGVNVAKNAGIGQLHIDFSTCDHITIGDRTVCGHEPNFHTTEIVGDTLVVNKITIGDDCQISDFVDIDGGSVMQNGTFAHAKTCIVSGTVALTPKDYVPRSGSSYPKVRPTGSRAVYQFFVMFSIELFVAFFGAAIFGSFFMCLFTGRGMPIFPVFVISMFMEAVFMEIMGAKLIGFVCMKLLLLGRNFKEGSMAVDSCQFIRNNEAINMVNRSKFQLDKGGPWASFLYWMFGWKIGKYSLIEECARCPLPGLSELGEATCHGASNIYTNSTMRHGVFTLKKLVIGGYTYAGNLCVYSGADPIPEGTRICTMATVTAETTFPPESESHSALVMGQPGKCTLTKRSKHADHTQWGQKIYRLLPAFINFIKKPMVVAATYTCTFVPVYILSLSSTGKFEHNVNLALQLFLWNFNPQTLEDGAPVTHLDWFYSVVKLPSSFLLLGFMIMQINMAFLFLFVTKWCFNGKLKSETMPACSLKASLVGDGGDTMDDWQEDNFAIICGTTYWNQMLRMLGCKIGKDCMLNSLSFTDYDLLEMGDKLTLRRSWVGAHTMTPDFKFQIETVKIGDNVSLGGYGCGTYAGTTIESNTFLHHATPLPKEAILEGEWVSCPCREVHTPFMTAMKLRWTRTNTACYDIGVLLGMFFILMCLLVFIEVFMVEFAIAFYAGNRVDLVFLFMVCSSVGVA